MFVRNPFLFVAAMVATLNLGRVSFASQEQQWISNGPYGGEVLSLAVDPVSGNIVYAGTAYGGVFKSTEGGLKGVPITIG